MNSDGLVAEEEVGYWDSIGAEWIRNKQDLLWRRHSDAVNIRLFLRWMGVVAYDLILKTDLFDEAVAVGLAPAIKGRCRRLIGMDISGSVTVAAKGKVGIPALTADVRSLPFPAETFEVIISNSTLDHFQDFADLVQALREFHRVLRQSGQLWITLDNASNPLIAMRNAMPFELLRKIGLVPYFVGVTCTYTQFRQTLVAAGFDVEEIGAVLHCPRAFSVRLTRFASRYFSPSFQGRVLEFLNGFERAGEWPTKYRTGHFLSARVKKRASQVPHDG